jgi:hypothetical protein
VSSILLIFPCIPSNPFVASPSTLSFASFPTTSSSFCSSFVFHIPFYFHIFQCPFHSSLTHYNKLYIIPNPTDKDNTNANLAYYIQHMIPFLHMKFNFLHYENQLPRTTPRCKHLCRVIFSFTFPSFVTKFSKTQSICLWMGVIIFLFIIHSKLNDDCNICECSSSFFMHFFPKYILPMRFFVCQCTPSIELAVG